ncbi:MAG: GH25 family lysozyme [Polyangiaceae bacterium]
MSFRASFAALVVLSALGLTACTGDLDDPGAPQGSEDLGEAQQAQVVCPDGATVPGIDVSVWQATVNWDSVAGDGIKFAIARASYGTSKDSYFDQNWAGMKNAGLVRGAYQYWLPSKDPIAQAQAMLDIMGPLGPGDLPPVVDVEQTDGLGPAEIVSRLKQWIGHVESAIGRKPIIYSGKYFWQDNVKSTDFLDYPLWIPNYSLECPDLPNGYWSDWHFFQYTDKGSVKGVSGNVDRNDWNGTLEELWAFADGGPKYGAKFVSQSFPYASEGALLVAAGEDIEVSLELTNTGTEPWDENTRLGTTEPRDRKSPFAGPEWPGPNRYAQVEGVVMPGETYTFKWIMHAPKLTGTYDEHFGLVQEGVAWFSDPGQGGPPDTQLEGRFTVVRPEDLTTGAVFPIGGGNHPVSRPDNGADPQDPESPAGCSIPASGPSPATPLFLTAALGVWATLRRRRSSQKRPTA